MIGLIMLIYFIDFYKAFCRKFCIESKKIRNLNMKLRKKKVEMKI